MAGHAGHSNGRRHAKEDQERRHQEPAPDAEHPGQESHKGTNRNQQGSVDRDFRDGEVDVQRERLRRPQRPSMARRFRVASSRRPVAGAFWSFW